MLTHLPHRYQWQVAGMHLRLKQPIILAAAYWRAGLISDVLM